MDWQSSFNADQAMPCGGNLEVSYVFWRDLRVNDSPCEVYPEKGFARMTTRSIWENLNHIFFICMSAIHISWHNNIISTHTSAMWFYVFNNLNYQNNEHVIKMIILLFINTIHLFFLVACVISK